jgi:hypothetical protein
MKKIVLKIGSAGLFILLLLNSCKDNIAPVVGQLNFTRAFTPVDITAQISNITTVTLTWNPVKNAAGYVMEIYQGTDFAQVNLIYTANLDTTSYTFVYVLPAGDTQFSARLKAISLISGVTDSKWIAATFRTAPENLFNGYKSEMTGLKTATIRWKPGSVATALAFNNGTLTSYPITPAEAAAGVKTLTVAQNGNYTVKLMNSTFVRGTTNVFLEGNVLLAAGDDLATAISNLPAGGVILLTNGVNYSFAGPINLNKSIKIRGLYSTNLPAIFTVLNAATYQMFNIDAGLTPSDSLVFQNLTITGYPDNNSANVKLRGMFDQDVTLACNIGMIKYQNCIARNFDRHLIRLRGTASQVIGNIVIDGCILNDYAFGSNYGVINSSAAASRINNINITNSTIYYTRGAIISYTNGTACQGINVKNCTFNQLAMDASTGRYLIDLNATAGTGVITVSNCIFGSTSAIANGIRPNTMTLSVTGTYYTSDFNDGIVAPVKSLMTAYAGASTALWTNPVNGIFTFLDPTFAGIASAGDPRWKP